MPSPITSKDACTTIFPVVASTECFNVSSRYGPSLCNLDTFLF